MKNHAVRSSRASPPTAPIPMPTPSPILFVHLEDVVSEVGHADGLLKEVITEIDGVVELAVALLEEEVVPPVDGAGVDCEATNPLSKSKCEEELPQQELSPTGPQHTCWSLQ